MYTSKLLAFIFFLTIAFNARAQQFLNGDFEINTCGGDQINMSNTLFNSEVPYSTSFGTYGDLDMITSSTYGPPQNGSWFTALTGGGTDQLSMQLSAPLVAGNTYTISFYDRKYSTFVSYPVEIGVSTSPTSMGTIVYTAPVSVAGVWTNRTFTFVAPNNGQYITVAANCCGTSDWVNIDNFTFVCALNLGPDTTLCTGVNYLLNATTANGTYLWQDGSTNPTFNVTTPGLYWAEVTTGACTLRDTVIVSYASSLLVNLGNDTSICNGQTVTLDAGNAGATYQWQDNSTSSTFSVTQSGLYWVNVTNGCSGSDTINITFNNPPIVNLGNDTSICNGQSIILDAGNIGAAYQWQDNSLGQTISVNQSRLYWVRVNNGCISSDSININFSNALAFSLGNDTAICAHDSVVLTAAQAGATYHWQDNSAQPTYTVTQSGNYSATITVSGCVANDTIHVNVRTAPVVNITTNRDTICGTDSAQVCATSGFVTYAWNVGQAITCIEARQAGNYYVTVTDNTGCTAESNHLSIHVLQQPPVSITVNGDTLTANGAVNCQWYLDGNAIPGATSAIYIIRTKGSYTLRVTDSNGCITFSNPVLSTGVEALNADGFVVYPNPLSTGNWQLKTGMELIGAEVQVYDDNGRIVFQSRLEGETTTLEFTAARGIYLLRISTGSKSLVKKLVKL